MNQSEEDCRDLRQFHFLINSMDAMAKDGKLHAHTRALLCTGLIQSFDVNGRCVVDYKTVQSESGLAKRLIKKHLKRLVKSGWLHREGKSKVYWLNLDRIGLPTIEADTLKATRHKLSLVD